VLNLKNLRLLSGTPVWVYGLMIALALGMAMCFLLLQGLMIETPQQQRLAERVQEYTRLQTGAANRFLSRHQQQFQQLASDPKLVEALEQPDRIVNIDSWLASVSEAKLPFSAIRVIAADDADFETSSNFIEIDLIKSTRSGNLPELQAARLDSWQFYFAQPVISGQKIIATLLATLPAVDIKVALDSVDGNLGKTTLIQQFPGNPAVPVVITGTGNQDLISATEATVIGNLSVSFNASSLLLESTRPASQFFWLTNGLLLLIVIYFEIRLLRHGLAVGKNSTSGNLILAMPVRTDADNETPGESKKSHPKKKKHTAPVYEFDKTKASFIKPDKGAKKPTGTGDSNPESSKPGATNYGPDELPDRVFRDYDIRGIADSEIDEKFARTLGKVLGTRALELGETEMVLGYDGRITSPLLAKSLADGILSTGCNLVNLGRVPTPVMNFATRTLEGTTSGVMVTASHNPAADNGFKIVISGHVLSSGEITTLRDRMRQQTWLQGEGKMRSIDLRLKYRDTIVSDIAPVNGLKVVVDCGNGVAGNLAPNLLKAIGCVVTPLYCEVDGNFPNHPPDPTVKANLADLISAVGDQEADLGVAIDGDGDRLVAVTASGRIVWPDELLMIFARDVVTRHPGCNVIFDVKSTRRLISLIQSYGGHPVMWKTGHAHMRNKMAETGAPVGGEFSGHLFFNDRWHGFDDGLYASARLLEILSLRQQTLDEIMASFPESVATPEIRVRVDDQKKFELITRLRTGGNFGDGKITDIDGLRVDFADGWGLARASNTSPDLTLRFEASSNESLDEIKNMFRQQLRAIDRDLNLDF